MARATGRAVGEVVQQPVQAVQHREGTIGGARRRLDASRGEQRFGERRRAVEQTVALGDRETRDDGLQQLPHAAIREVALQLRCSGAQAGEARLIGGLPPPSAGWSCRDRRTLR